MPSITTWTRLEPRSRHQDMSAFLQARVADPLWALAVQWRIGELIGQDAAFPIRAETEVTVRPLVHASSTTDPQIAADASLAAEPVYHDSAGWAVQQGAELMAQLEDYGVSDTAMAAVLTAFPYVYLAGGSADAQGESYLQLLSGRLPDAAALEPVLRSAVASGALSATMGIPAVDTGAVLSAAAAWLHDVDGRVPSGAANWRPELLEYDLSLHVVTPTGVFASANAQGWNGDDLDWYHFDLTTPVPGAPPYPTLPAFPPSGSLTASTVPHPLTFPGAPDPRYWAMEDAAVNFASVQVVPSDLARMLLVEFATVTSPDWYLQPLTLPVGAIHSVTLIVTNTFGERVVVPQLAPSVLYPGHAPTAVPDWVMFRPSTLTDSGVAPLDGLLLPSLTADMVRSAPVESVTLVRDDSQNRAWALETVVTGSDGRPFDRFHAATDAELPTTNTADDGSTVRYQLVSPLPAWAFPLLATDSAAPAVELVLPDEAHPPLGVLLNDIRGRQVQQQQIPPWQATLIRHRYLARGPDGQLLVWTGRRYLLGGAERSVPLRFDQALGTDR